jgi:hypothetical protein
MNEAEVSSALNGAVRRWLATFLGTAGGTLLAVAAVNYSVNPLGYYPVHLFPAVTWSSRQTKFELLRARPDAEVLVLGSSRSMKLAPRDVESHAHRPAFNAAVDSAMVEDWFCMLRYAVEVRRIPLREIVLGVDIEAFRNDKEPDARLLVIPEFRSLLPWTFTRDYYVTASSALLSGEQLMTSLRSVQLRLHGYPEGTLGSFEPDGFWHYPRQVEAQMAAKTFVPDFQSSMGEYDFRFSGFHALDERRRDLFESLLDYARSRNVRVRCFITPLSAPLLAHLRVTRDFDRVHRVVGDYLSSLTQRFANFTVSDFTDIASVGGDPKDYFDGAHMGEANSRRVVDALYAEGATSSAETR